MLMFRARACVSSSKAVPFKKKIKYITLDSALPGKRTDECLWLLSKQAKRTSECLCLLPKQGDCFFSEKQKQFGAVDR